MALLYLEFFFAVTVMETMITFMVALDLYAFFYADY